MNVMQRKFSLVSHEMLPHYQGRQSEGLHCPYRLALEQQLCMQIAQPLQAPAGSQKDRVRNADITPTLQILLQEEQVWGMKEQCHYP